MMPTHPMRGADAAEDASDERPRFFHVHMQKTAGTSLNGMLRRAFGDQAVYPTSEDGSAIARVIDTRNLRERLDARGHEISVVVGHFPLATVDVLPGSFRTFTLLREPVARILSFIRHQRRDDPSKRSLSDMEIYKGPVHHDALLRNHMVKMLALPKEAVAEGGILAPVDMVNEDLERAKQALTEVDVVGMQSEFAAFTAALDEAFGWDLGSPMTRNQTEPASHDPAFLEQVRAENHLDVELYHFALSLLAERGPFSDRTRPSA